MKTAAHILCSLFILSAFTYAQTLPDYFERKSILNLDSIQAANYSSVASDGIIEPENYFPGPGDRFLVVISGLEEIVHNAEINHEGFIFIPKAGPVSCKDKSLAEFRNEIETQIRKNYKNITVFISLVNLRKIKIYAGGEILKPGSFTLSANSRLSDLVYMAGLQNTTSIRNIKVTHRNGKSNFYDCLSFFRLNKKSENPYLQEGDFVFLDKVTKIINMNGAVKFPGTYELKDGETLSGIIELCGGVLPQSRIDSLELISFEADNSTQFSTILSLSEVMKKDIRLKNMDRAIVRQIPKYLEENIIQIDGYVRYPGIYKIKENSTKLSDVIEEAGGFLPEASLLDATLRRDVGSVDADPEFERLKLILRADMTDDEYDYFKSKSRQRKGKVVIDFQKLFENNDADEDIVLMRDDRISVPKKKDYVVLIGQVVHPGNVEFKDNYTIDDYIRSAGGLGWRALEDDIRLVRSNTGEWIDIDDVDKIYPGDIIWIPEDPPPPKFWTIFQTSLNVLGQVATVIAATVAVIVSVR